MKTNKNNLDKTQKELLNCIFDVICDNAYSKKSLKYIKTYHKNKNFEVNYTNKNDASIKLSKNFILKLQ